MSSLIVQLLVASLAVGVSCLVHLAGLALLVALLAVHARRLSTPHALANEVVRVVGSAFGLFALHTAEIWLYAVLYMTIGGFRALEPALYFSTASYVTMGAGEVALPLSWRILGAVEAVNGVILLGWSTAFFVSVVRRLGAIEADWPAASTARSTVKASERRPERRDPAAAGRR